eukprot:Platyproteum_vivax@DN1127_c0_g1_i1.p1
METPSQRAPNQKRGHGSRSKRSDNSQRAKRRDGKLPTVATQPPKKTGDRRRKTHLGRLETEGLDSGDWPSLLDVATPENMSTLTTPKLCCAAQVQQTVSTRTSISIDPSMHSAILGPATPLDLQSVVAIIGKLEVLEEETEDKETRDSETVKKTGDKETETVEEVETMETEETESVHKITEETETADGETATAVLSKSLVGGEENENESLNYETGRKLQEYIDPLANIRELERRFVRYVPPAHAGRHRMRQPPPPPPPSYIWHDGHEPRYYWTTLHKDRYSSHYHGKCIPRHHNGHLVRPIPPPPPARPPPSIPPPPAEPCCTMDSKFAEGAVSERMSLEVLDFVISQLYCVCKQYKTMGDLFRLYHTHLPELIMAFVAQLQSSLPQLPMTQECLDQLLVVMRTNNVTEMLNKALPKYYED